MSSSVPFPMRRVATGEATTVAGISIGGMQDVTVTFDVALPDTNYNAAVTIYNSGGTLLGTVIVAGVKTKSAGSCVVVVKNTGLSIFNNAVTVEVVAVRKVMG